MIRAILLLALVAVATAFNPARFFGAGVSSTRLYANCDAKVMDAKGRCPGETGYKPILREAPTDFAAYQAQMKAAKEAASAPKVGNCDAKVMDAKGRCPGETGYKPVIREAPTDFAAYQAQLKAKKAAGN